ncbi:MAG TPA: tyrosine-type recombinase/integrase [Candidatus Babeliales bacterium]|jgi:integrase/recombinase XerD|nr:tyrosine-type recombinase/integrase [Candidatus Babeliales bacterium]
MNNQAYVIRFEAYLLSEQQVSYNTVQAYKKDIAQLVHFLDERALLFNQTTVTHLKEFIAVLCADQLRASTRARKIAAIKALYRYLHKHHAIPNIAQDLLMPKQEQLLPHYLSPEEISRLCEVAHQDTSITGKRNEVILHLLYGSGMRVSELVALTISDIQYDVGVLRIGKGKGSKQRLIPLPGQLLSLLKEYITEVYPVLLKRDTISISDKQDYLFPHIQQKTIKPLTRQTVWAIIKRLCVAAGITRAVSPHQLRHSLATHMLDAGADLRSLQLLLGHEKLSTVQIYTHVETATLRSIYDKKHPRSQ